LKSRGGLRTARKKTMIKLALSRGRILEEALPLLRKVGFSCKGVSNNSRKLVHDFPKEGIKIFIIRPTDVPVYVEYGAADVGVVGRDTLLEEGMSDLYEPLDLEIGECKLVVAGPVDFKFSSGVPLRVATKYPRITQEYFSKKGIAAEVVKLYGSVEIAPLVGLADLVVDLTSTGETLRKNNLVEIEKIADITARLIVNRVSMKIKSAEIKSLIEKLRGARE